MLVKERVVIEEPYEQYARQTAQPDRQTAPSGRKKAAGKLKPKQNHMLSNIVKIFFVVVAACAAMMAMSAYSSDATKALRTDKDVLTKLVKENEHLQLDLARLKSPERIQVIAKEELKMSVPKVDYRPTTKSVAAPPPQIPMAKQTATNNIVGKMENFIKNIIS